MKKNTDATILSKEAAEILVPFAPEVQNLALAVRTFIFKMIPGVTEMIDTKARNIGHGYSPNYIDMVSMILPTKAGVTLGIAYATQLPDPEKILEGTGKLHRHVKLKSKSDLETVALKPLLSAASAAAITQPQTADRKPKRTNKTSGLQINFYH
jgi:Domain of unknown function (DU1801)